MVSRSVSGRINLTRSLVESVHVVDCGRMSHDSACLSAEDCEGGNPTPVGWLGVTKPGQAQAYRP
jgi:hypothetical protein